MSSKPELLHFSRISQLLRYMGLPAPTHPLVALIDYASVQSDILKSEAKISIDFYKISFKNTFNGQIRYGQSNYDFEEGGLAFLKPRQIVFSTSNVDSYEGYALYFHPDFIRKYPLGSNINRYGFFSYAVSEALFLSALESDTISDLFARIGDELKKNIDSFSQDILVSQIELLLSYSNRFYNRQFITRKTENHEIIASLDRLLNEYFEKEMGLKDGVPSVQYISTKLNLSQRYLSDMLRSLTGQNTQQYIQNSVIEHSKDLLSATSLSISQVAYKMGFEHPQSFSKLFKTKTNLSPLEFRQSFN